MTADAAMAARARLRHWLEGDVVVIESRIEENTATPSEGEIRNLLLEAIAGLEALDAGVIPEIFSKDKKPSWYGTGATIPGMKLQALGYVALLRRLDDPAVEDYSAAAALNLVAAAYGYGQHGGETVRQWEKQFKKQRPEELREAKRIARGLYNGWKLGSHTNSGELVLQAIARAGRKYQSVRKRTKDLMSKGASKSQGTK